MTLTEAYEQRAARIAAERAGVLDMIGRSLSPADARAMLADYHNRRADLGPEWLRRRAASQLPAKDYTGEVRG